MSEVINRESLLELLAKRLSQSDTTYVSFCAELEASQNSKTEINWFCNHRCQIHKMHNSHSLLCLPLSYKAVLAKEE